MLAVFSWVLATAFFSLPLFDSLEWKLQDLWAERAYGSNPKDRPISPDVVVIKVDEGLFENMGLAWPLDKNVYGDLLDYLDTLGAQAVVFDVLFTENLNACGNSDELFRAMLEYTPNSVLTFGALIDPALPAPASPLLPDRYHFGPAAGNLTPMFGAIIPYSQLLASAPHLAANSLKSMEDGIDRRVPLFVRDGNFLISGMGLEGALLARNVSTAERSWDPSKQVFHWKNHSIPTDKEGNIYPSFADSIPEYEFSEVRRSQAAFYRGEPAAIGKRALAGKVIYVGTGAPSLGDLGSTPLSGLSRFGRSPNVLMHARACNAILTGHIMRPWSRSEVLTLSAIFLLISWLVAGFISTRLGLVLQLIGMTLIVLASRTAYSWHVLFPVLEILTAQVLFWAAALWVAYQERDRDHRYLQRTFSTYLSPELINDMARQREYPQLGGVEVQGSALFSDIAGFSGFSESLTPPQLVALLNEYFERMTDVLLEHGATVDKFIGDAIVAFWGAPRATPDHAQQAVRAALAMQQALEELRQGWMRRSDIPESARNMRTRIGVNSGRFVVGNMGCSRRMHYTMMGDAVNLAARLETISGQYGVEILMGEDCKLQISAEFHYRKIDCIRVKGRKNAVDVFEVLRVTNPSLDKAYTEAWLAYVNADFEDAERLFLMASQFELRPEINPSLVLSKRCVALHQTSPKDWQGVWSWEHK